MNTSDRAVVGFLQRNPGSTQLQVAAAFPVESYEYGIQRAVSRSIARLRKARYVKDVAHRCRHCGVALTRGQKNVQLFLTAKGRRFDWRRRDG